MTVGAYMRETAAYAILGAITLCAIWPDGYRDEATQQRPAPDASVPAFDWNADWLPLEEQSADERLAPRPQPTFGEAAIADAPEWTSQLAASQSDTVERSSGLLGRQIEANREIEQQIVLDPPGEPRAARQGRSGKAPTAPEPERPAPTGTAIAGNEPGPSGGIQRTSRPESVMPLKPASTGGEQTRMADAPREVVEFLPPPPQ